MLCSHNFGSLSLLGVVFMDRNSVASLFIYLFIYLFLLTCLFLRVKEHKLLKNKWYIWIYYFVRISMTVSIICFFVKNNYPTGILETLIIIDILLDWYYIKENAKITIEGLSALAYFLLVYAMMVLRKQFINPLFILFIAIYYFYTLVNSLKKRNLP